MHRWRAAVSALTAALTMLACTASWNWREFRVADTALHIAMPCRPDQQARTIALAGRTVRWTVLVCSHAQQTFALGWADMGEPAAVGLALSELARGSAAKLQATMLSQAPAAVPGMTPQPAATSTSLQGRRPDGQAAWAEVLVFAHGLQVYQLTWLGAQAAAEPARHFLQAPRVRP